MEKPHVVEVRGDKVGGHWWVITNDQREWHLRKSLYPDELSAFLAVTQALDEQEQNDEHHP